MTPTDDPQHDFIERLGLFFSKSGLPATSGRILGHLLTCDPPVQSSGEIAAALETTSGSVSTNTRLLERTKLIERVPVRGRRGAFFQVAPDAFTRILTSEQAKVREFRELLELGLESMGEAQPEQRARLEDARDVYAFYEAEMPRMVERFLAGQATKRAAEEDRG